MLTGNSIYVDRHYRRRWTRCSLVGKKHGRNQGTDNTPVWTKLQRMEPIISHY